MRVNADSWHYRAYRHYCLRTCRAAPIGWETPNLCTYARRIVVASAVNLVIIAFLGVMLFSIGSLICDKPLASLAVFVGMIVFVGVASFIAALIGTAQRKRDAVKRPPGIFRAYLRAKKQRICPLIEFVEPK